MYYVYRPNAIYSSVQNNKNIIGKVDWAHTIDSGRLRSGWIWFCKVFRSNRCAKTSANVIHSFFFFPPRNTLNKFKQINHHAGNALDIRNNGGSLVQHAKWNQKRAAVFSGSVLAMARISFPSNVSTDWNLTHLPPIYSNVLSLFPWIVSNFSWHSFAS